MTIQVKANAQYVPVGQSVILDKVVLTFDSVDEILRVIISLMKATEQCVPVVQSVILDKVVLTFESVD